MCVCVHKFQEYASFSQDDFKIVETSTMFVESSPGHVSSLSSFIGASKTLAFS